MPFVSIKFVAENIAADPEGKKNRIADRVAQAVSDEMGIQKNEVWVEKDDGTTLFDNDASFHERAGLADSAAGVSYESLLQRITTTGLSWRPERQG